MKKVLLITIICILTLSLFAVDNIYIGGKTYLEYTTNDSGEGEFSSNRMYLDIKRKLDDNLLRFTTDIDTSGKYEVYTKYLYLEMTKLIPGASINLGQIATLWPGFVDKASGLRYLQKSLTDKYGVYSTADRGLSIKVKPEDEISFEAAFLNGSGYKSDDTDNRRDIAVRLDFQLDGVVLAIHTQITGTQPISGNAVLSVFNFLSSYKTDLFTLGCEYATGKNLTQDIQGVSVYGKLNFGIASLLARYDYFDSDTAEYDDQQVFNLVGIEKTIAKNVKATANWRRDTTGNNDPSDVYAISLEAKI